MAFGSLLPAVTLLLALAAGPSAAQETPAQETPKAAQPAASQEQLEEDLSKPMGPPDPFNRGTPRGSMYGFIMASRGGKFERAAEFLDLRRLPPDDRERGSELARRFKAVLDETLWVDFATLSDSNAGFADDGLPDWQDRLGDIGTRAGPVTLLLQRVPRKDDSTRIWKVSSVTVARIDDLYDEFGPSRIEAYLPPVFFEVVFRGLALWKWVGLVLLVLAAWGVSLLVAGTSIRVLVYVFTRRQQEVDPRVVQVMRGPVRLALSVLIFSLGRHYLALGLQVEQVLRLAERLLWVVALAWLFFRLIDLYILALRLRSEQRGNLGLVPVLVPIQRFGKVLIVVIGVLGILGTLGVNISAAVAGLGVGGIAVALAAQKSLENLFGGVTLFADRPVRVGDFCKYGDQIGTVEEIGLRSTRVRTLDRTVVTVPNAEFSNMKLENYADRDRMRLWTILGVRYETTPDQMRFLLAKLREILWAHPRITDDPARVRFVGFGAYSLDLEVFAYVDTRDWSELLQVREDVYLRFMDAVAEAGTGFAFPSSTVYLGRDDGLADEDARRAEAHVAAWREQGELPFPHFSQEARERAHNTLDWPPPGSPEGRPIAKPGKE